MLDQLLVYKDNIGKYFIHQLTIGTINFDKIFQLNFNFNLLLFFGGGGTYSNATHSRRRHANHTHTMPNAQQNFTFSSTVTTKPY